MESSKLKCIMCTPSTAEQINRSKGLIPEDLEGYDIPIVSQDELCEKCRSFIRQLR
jgi:hypothetical protein